jgi:cytochrome P450
MVLAREHDEPRMPKSRTAHEMMAMDPPDHTRLRKRVAKAFTVRRVEALRDHTRRLINDLVDDMVEHGAPVDFVDKFAFPLPVVVICELLGVPRKADCESRTGALPNFAFGHGAHIWFGAPPARVELQGALRVSLDRLPALRPARDVEGVVGASHSGRRLRLLAVGEGLTRNDPGTLLATAERPTSREVD